MKRVENHDQPVLWDEQGGEPQQRRRTPPLLPVQRPAKPMEFRALWDIEEVASYLGVPKQTVYSRRQSGYGPKGFRVGKHLRWRAATVIEWTLGLEREP